MEQELGGSPWGPVDSTPFAGPSAPTSFSVARSQSQCWKGQALREFIPPRFMEEESRRQKGGLACVCTTPGEAGSLGPRQAAWTTDLLDSQPRRPHHRGARPRCRTPLPPLPTLTGKLSSPVTHPTQISEVFVQPCPPRWEFLESRKVYY